MGMQHDLYEHYRELVESGHLSPHDVPGPREMAHDWCVSSWAAREARRLLMDAGLATSVPRPLRSLGTIKDRDWERFLAKVDPVDENGCMKWNASTFGDGGYGNFYLNGMYVQAHRVAYAYLVGPVPQGFEIDHVYARGCRSKACVNIEHLEAVTRRENQLRRVAAIRDRAARPVTGP